MTKTILVMDPDDLSRGETAVQLRSSGYEVTEAHEAAQAVDLLNKDRYDVLVLGMLPSPGSFGVLLVSRLKWPGMRIIVMADVTRDELENLMFQGVEFMADPLDAAELEAAVTGLDRDHESITYH
jgi:DNA-binding response OmpR family regulator